MDNIVPRGEIPLGNLNGLEDLVMVLGAENLQPLARAGEEGVRGITIGIADLSVQRGLYPQIGERLLEALGGEARLAEVMGYPSGTNVDGLLDGVAELHRRTMVAEYGLSVDATWDEISRASVVRLMRETALGLGLDPETATNDTIAAAGYRRSLGLPVDASDEDVRLAEAARSQAAIPDSPSVATQTWEGAQAVQERLDQQERARGLRNSKWRQT
jgi:hypothetical protein